MYFLSLHLLPPTPSPRVFAKRPIFRADDAALSEGTNLGIREVAAAGAVRNIGLMACGPALAHAAEVFLPLGDRVCFGVHATLNSEFVHPRLGPILAAAEVPDLVQPDGTFFPRVTDWAPTASLRSIECEIRAQITRIRRAGFQPAYLDTHMVFQWVEGCEALLRALCVEEGLVWGDGVPKLKRGQSQEEMCGPFRRIFHPAYPDDSCQSLMLVDSGRDLLPGRIRETESLLARAAEYAHGGKFSDLRTLPGEVSAAGIQRH